MFSYLLFQSLFVAKCSEFEFNDCGGISTKIGSVNIAQNSRFITLKKAVKKSNKKGIPLLVCLIKQINR